VLAPFEAGVLGHLGLVVVEALHASDLSDDTPGEDGAKAGVGIHGVGDRPHGLRDGSVEPLLLSLQEGDVPEAHSQDEVD